MCDDVRVLAGVTVIFHLASCSGELELRISPMPRGIVLLILAEYFNALCIVNHLLNEVLGVAGTSDASRMYSFETLFVHHQVLSAVD